MARPDPFIGKVIDQRYRLVEKIGAGGFGAVYKAEHLRLGSPFAIKFMFAMLAQDESMIARFEREAKTTSLLHHPHIVDVVDFGEEPVLGLYLVMEFLVGETLRQRIRRDGAADAATIVRIADPICQALVTAHERGVIHRDLKPPNVFLVRTDVRDDFVKILDFGIAGLTDDGGKSLTKTGMVMGSPPYMSPEQAWARKLDHRTDIYSLGVILYEMATGATPFRSDSDVAILDMHRSAAPEPPRRFRPDLTIPPRLEKVILRCLAKAPEERYQSIQAVRRDLATLGTELGVSGIMEVPAPGMDEPEDAGATAIIQSTAPESTVLGAASPREAGAPSEAAAVEAASDSRTGREPSSTSPTRRLVLLATVGALAVVAALVVVLLPDAPSAADSAHHETAPAEATGGALAEAPPVEEATPAVAGVASITDPDVRSQPDGVDAEVAATEQDVASPRPAHLVLETEPTGARVLLGDAELCVTPCDVELPATGADIALRIEREGYEDKAIDVQLAEGADIYREFRLEREPRRRKTTRRAKKKEPARKSPGDLPGIRLDSAEERPARKPAPLPKLRVE